MNWEVKNVFAPGPVISFTIARKTSSYLVMANLYPLDRNIGSKTLLKKDAKSAEKHSNLDMCIISVIGWPVKNASGNTQERQQITLC